MAFLRVVYCGSVDAIDVSNAESIRRIAATLEMSDIAAYCDALVSSTGASSSGESGAAVAAHSEGVESVSEVAVLRQNSAISSLGGLFGEEKEEKEPSAASSSAVAPPPPALAPAVSGGCAAEPISTISVVERRAKWRPLTERIRFPQLTESNLLKVLEDGFVDEDLLVDAFQEKAAPLTSAQIEAISAADPLRANRYRTRADSDESTLFLSSIDL